MMSGDDAEIDECAHLLTNFKLNRGLILYYITAEILDVDGGMSKD